jgi:hypothetical protein
MTDAVKTKAVRVRAIAPGFSTGRRRLGDEFDYEARLNDKGEPVLGSWMQLIGEAVPEPKAKAKGKAAEPKTLAEGAKSIGADLV